jgi:MATE family multidrug resistance protein
VTSSPLPLATDTRTELRLLVRLSAPIAIAQFGLVAMGLVDTAIVGRVGSLDLAGTAMGRSISFAALSLCMGVATALEPLAAQAIGAGAPERAYASLVATLRAALLLCVPTVLASFVATLLLAPLGVQPELIPRVRSFLLGYIPGFFGFVGFLAGKTFLQARGETRPALVASLAANVVNAVVCSVLVLGDRALVRVGMPPLGLPRLGALGAGLATSVSSVVLAALVLWPAARHRPVRAPEPVPPRRVLSLGVPVGLQLLAEIGVFSLVALVAGRLGDRVVSAHQVALGLASFTFMGALGVSGATAARVGHAVGAGLSPRRVGLLGIALGAAVMSAGAVAFGTIPRALVRAFTPEPDVVALGAKLVSIAALFQLFDGVQAVAAGALRGAGDVRFPFVANVAAHWFVGLPIALGLGFGLGLGAPGLWWGLTAGLVTVAIALTARFLVIARGRIERV